jgi:hypothetical protein
MPGASVPMTSSTAVAAAALAVTISQSSRSVK